MTGIANERAQIMADESISITRAKIGLLLAMAFSMINQILQELQVNGTDDVPKSVKSLEHLCKKFQNPALLQELYSQSEDNIIALSKLACSTYLFFLSSAKLARALDKVFKLLPSVYVKNINKEIEKELCQLLSQSNQKELKLLSSLLEQNSWAQSCVKKFFPELTKLLLSVLHLLKFGDKSKWTLDDLEHNHYVFKIIIQVEQLFQVEIKNLFNTRSTENKFHTSCLENEWEQIIGALLQLFLQTSNRDILILIGTAISMSLNLSMPINCIGSIYMDLIDLLSKEKRSFMFGNVNICCREQDCEINDQSNHTLAIIKGLLVCCDARILSEDGGHLMLHIYPPLIKLCLGSVEYQYLAFQTLSLWYQKLALLTQEERRSFNSYLQILDQTFVFEDNFKSLMNETFLMSSSENVDKTLLEVPLKDLSHLALFSVNCPILRSTLSCIWLNWDSPVSGVPEYVAVIFSTLLSVWHSTCEKQSGCRQVCDILLQHVLSSDTQSKAKYRPLALLIPYIDGCKLIQGNLPLRDELISCMKFNHLAAIATDIYKAFIEQLQLMLGKKCITQWKQLWMPALITGLTSEDSLQRSKTCTYWLAPTLRIIPNSHTELLNSLEHYFHAESKSRMKYLYLFGWVNVLRFLRELICVPFPIMSIKLLKQALSCPHDDVRSEALLVICCTVKRAEPLSEVEMDLLKAFIPNNLKTDCAQFRHCLVSGLRKVLVRIRDSCLTAVNKKKTDEDFLDRSLNFVEWLYEVIMLSLSPGSSYQCRRTAVDILTAILETLIFDENETSKKGKAQESSETLIRYVHSKSMWNFFSDPNFVTVLTCLEDGAREIQSLCYNLLDKYFKWQRDEADIHAKVPHMYKHASALLSSPRAYETHTGILIMSLIFKKYTLSSLNFA
ncbi:hypothetical protein Btru_032619 [Bulinus truncatus]|nr:hypothetical protein Btru_032619 [Bulinus truncatus]